MTNVIILQRVIPSYRLPVLRRINAELGWQAVYGENLGVQLESDAPFIHGLHFRQRRKPATRVDVPLAEILDRFKPDAVVAEGALGMSSTWELLARRWCGNGPKVFFWTIGYHPARPRIGVRGVLSQAPYLSVYGAADGCILYGDDGFRFLRQFFPKKALFVARNTVDIDEIRRMRDTAEPNPRAGSPELVSIGRMIPEKDFPMLVRAFCALKLTVPEARLTIIGDGPERHAIETAAGEELNRSIFLPGAIYKEAEIARYMLAADALIMGGRIGLAINHALAYDLPVIAFARTATGPYHGSEILSLVNDVTGQLVPKYTQEALTTTLIAFFSRYKDPKHHFTPRIRTFIEEQLTVEHMVEGFRALDRHLRGT